MYEDIADAESKSKSSLTLGILSMALCWLFAIPGLIMAPIAIANGKKARQVLNEDDYYFWNALAGVITGSIGLGLSIMCAIIYLLSFITALAYL